MFHFLSRAALQTQKAILAKSIVAPAKNVQLVQQAFMNCKYFWIKKN